MAQFKDTPLPIPLGRVSAQTPPSGQANPHKLVKLFLLEQKKEAEASYNYNMSFPESG